LPVVAPAGDGTTMLVALHVVGVAVVPLNVTVLVPCVAPKFAPAIVTGVPAMPNGGDKLEIVGGTVKLTPLLGSPATVTTTLPVVVPAGTGTTMLVALQLVGVAGVPLNVTVLVPCVAPKFAPASVTGVPIAPAAGEALVRLGGTVNGSPLLPWPPTVTTMLPVVAPAGTGTTILVALQVVGAAVVPLNVTVLVPCVVPKFAPLIVTGVPAAPDAGERFVRLGGGVTVNVTPLLG
jgi:hypothetical protein